MDTARVYCFERQQLEPRPDRCSLALVDNAVDRLGTVDLSDVNGSHVALLDGAQNEVDVLLAAHGKPSGRWTRPHSPA